MKQVACRIDEPGHFCRRQDRRQPKSLPIRIGKVFLHRRAFECLQVEKPQCRDVAYDGAYDELSFFQQVNFVAAISSGPRWSNRVCE